MHPIIKRCRWRCSVCFFLARTSSEALEPFPLLLMSKCCALLLVSVFFLHFIISVPIFLFFIWPLHSHDMYAVKSEPIIILHPCTYILSVMRNFESAIKKRKKKRKGKIQYYQINTTLFHEMIYERWERSTAPYFISCHVCVSINCNNTYSHVKSEGQYSLQHENLLKKRGFTLLAVMNCFEQFNSSVHLSCLRSFVNLVPVFGSFYWIQCRNVMCVHRTYW